MMYEITEATIDEIPEMTRIAQGFEQASSHVKVNYEHSVKTYINFINSGIGVVLLLKKDNVIIGGLGAIKAPDLHEGVMMAIETFWFVSPEHRGRGLTLFDAFEEWAERNGCIDKAMIHMVDSYPGILEKFYTRSGYELVEKHYVKRGKRP